MLHLRDKAIKAAITDLFKEQKESMIIKVKEDMMTMPHQIKKTNKGTALTKNSQMEVLYLRSTTEIKRIHLRDLADYIWEKNKINK